MKKKWKFIGIITAISLIIDYFISVVLSSMFNNKMKVVLSARYFTSSRTFLVLFLLVIGEGLLGLLYYWNHYWLLNSKNIIKGKKRDLHLSANLEQARFQSKEELQKNYKTYDFDELKNVELVGTPIQAKERHDHLLVTFSKPAHSLVIGTTGSGKTTTFVSPVIQILSETKNKPSLFISDPKGELLADHQAALIAKGYEVKVVDDEDINDVLTQIELHRFDKVLASMTQAKKMANPYSQKPQIQAIEEAIKMLGDELEISSPTK
jgi:hypothetical protein